MANDFARIRRDIWGDEDWRRLSMRGQWLYMHLLTSPALTFAGVTDWRPPRIAAHASDGDAVDVQEAAMELMQERFVLPDPTTEEVVIRSWVKHDGLLRSPNMTKAFVKAHRATASGVLRSVVVDQLERLRERGAPGCWNLLEELFEQATPLPFDEGVAQLWGNPSENPSGNPSANPSGKG